METLGDILVSVSGGAQVPLEDLAAPNEPASRSPAIQFSSVSAMRHVDARELARHPTEWAEQWERQLDELAAGAEVLPPV